MKRQGTLFGEEVLPLFSGTAPRGEVESFTPQTVPRQPAMFCPLCKGTGEVLVEGRRVRCLCPQGQQVTEEQ